MIMIILPRRIISQHQWLCCSALAWEENMAATPQFLAWDINCDVLTGQSLSQRAAWKPLLCSFGFASDCNALQQQDGDKLKLGGGDALNRNNNSYKVLFSDPGYSLYHTKNSWHKHLHAIQQLELLSVIQQTTIVYNIHSEWL